MTRSAILHIAQCVPPIAIASLLVVATGCVTSSGPSQVVRTSTIQNLALDEQSSIQTTGLNTGDIEPMAQKMVRSILSSPAIRTVAVSAPGDPVRLQGVPRIALRPILNHSSERIDVSLITARIRTELIKNANGRLEFIYRTLETNDAGFDKAIQAEERRRNAGIVDAPPDLARKTADFFLMGEIREHRTVTAGGRDRLLIFSFYLVNIETDTMVWADDYSVRRASFLSTSYRGEDR